MPSPTTNALTDSAAKLRQDAITIKKYTDDELRELLTIVATELGKRDAASTAHLGVSPLKPGEYENAAAMYNGTPISFPVTSDPEWYTKLAARINDTIYPERNTELTREEYERLYQGDFRNDNITTP